FWQARNILPHLKNIDHAIMTVGGWFDAEDLYGPLHTYGTIEKNNPNTYNTIVMGPWSHGDWARDKVHQLVGNIHFGDYISDFYQKEIERNFFNHFLKDGPQGNLPEAYMFDTGAKEWNTFDAWPPKAEDLILYPQADGQLLEATPEDTPSSFVSDPMKPVPYTEDIEWRFTPRPYMTGDQRFASRRPDVLSYESEPLEADLTIAGPIMAELWVSTDQGDADWVVKLIDVYPGDYPENPLTPNGKELSNYEMMVRSEAMRGRFRESFETPKPFEPNTPTKVELPLQDVLHTFKKGHRIKIHIQSTWFPLIDRNPQKYVDNIFEAKDGDFTKANHQVYHDKNHQTKI
ncbi:MAG: CocE/NonD family hydrolase, partial [Bacteroidota bacterium]